GHLFNADRRRSGAFMPIYGGFRRVLSENRRLYLQLNIIVYGIHIVMISVTALIPGMYEAALERQEAFLGAPGSSSTNAAYAGGNIAAATLLTFLATLLFAALLTTTLPSLVIPFFGAAATVWRAVEIGMWFAPASPEKAIAVISGSPVLVI